MVSTKSRSRFRDALDGLDADGLRSFLDSYAASLDREAQEALSLALLAHATRHGSFRPESPGEAAASQAEKFARAAAQAGLASPAKVDDHLRVGMAAFLARDYACARRILEALLRPLESGDIDVGADETPDEVLATDLNDCAAMCLAATYFIAAPEDRPSAVLEAVESLDSLAWLSTPIAAMEGVSPEPLPGMAEFLPSWLSCLQQDPRGTGSGEYCREERLREAIGRLEGPEGLARLARETRAFGDLSAWCQAVAATGDPRAALAAHEEAAALCQEPIHRAGFLDAAARAALDLGLADYRPKLEAAWLAYPSLDRVLRWLAGDDPSPATLRERASKTLASCPSQAGRARGLLLLLGHEFQEAARSLATAPGLGWSSESHPGHLLFPAASWLLGEAAPDSLRKTCAAMLQQGRLSFDGENLDPVTSAQEPGKDTLPTPTVGAVLDMAALRPALQPKDRQALLNALRSAAINRVDRVLDQKRRRVYDHAAWLVGCTLEAEQAAGIVPKDRQWAEDLQRRYSRFSAFQAELGRVLRRRG